MLNNISTTDENNYYLKNIPRNGTRVVKLSNFTPFATKTKTLKEEYRKEHPLQDESKDTNNQEVKSENANVNQEIPATPEEPKAETALPFTSEEVLLSKKDSLGIEVYNDIESNIINLQDYQSARRLRVNGVVVGNANRTRNVLGTKRINQESKDDNESQESKVENTPFDFSKLNRIDDSLPNQDVTSYEEKFDSDTKLDEWLNKENTTKPITNDAMLNEVNELQAKRNDNAHSLATQKEILEALRARVASNEELCRQRKLQLEEDNLALTQELNDVLAEINQLTSLANEQEAFLGISSESDDLGKAR